MSTSRPNAIPSPMPRPRTTALILALAFIARLLPFLSLVARHTTTWIYTRGLETGFVAHSLLTHEGFASPFGGHTGPTALTSPGYTLLVAAVFRIFGEASTASAIVILLAQIALGVLTTWLIMRLAGRLTGTTIGPRAATVAGSFFALWPPLLWVPTIFWDTSFTLCLLPALLLLALELQARPTLVRWLAFGALTGTAVLINLAFVPTAIAIFLWTIRSTPQRRNALLAALLALAIYAPWPIRNAEALHAFIPLRTTVGLELWMGNREGANGFLDESVFPYYNHAELSQYLQQGEVAYMQGKSDAAKTYIRRHPGTFIALSTKRAIRFWTGAGNQHGAPLYIVGALATTLLGLAGFFTLYQRGSRTTCLLLAIPLVLFPLPYYITHAEFRYRLAIDPLLTALAACFIALKAPVAESSAEPIPAPEATPEAA